MQPAPDSLLTHSVALRNLLQTLRQMGMQDGKEHQGEMWHTPADAGDSDVVRVLPDSASTPAHVTPYYFPSPVPNAVPIMRAHVHPWSGQDIPPGLFRSFPGGGHMQPGPSPADIANAQSEGLIGYVVDGPDARGNVYRINPDNGAVQRWSLAQAGLPNLGFSRPLPARNAVLGN